MNNKGIDCLGDNGVCVPMAKYTIKKTNKTNADRIRSMLDEELAEFIIKVRDCCSTNYCEGCPFGKNGCSKNKICEWLQSEAE